MTINGVHMSSRTEDCADANFYIFVVLNSLEWRRGLMLHFQSMNVAPQIRLKSAFGTLNVVDEGNMYM